jgi:protein gp37
VRLIQSSRKLDSLALHSVEGWPHADWNLLDSKTKSSLCRDCISKQELAHPTGGTIMAGYREKTWNLIGGCSKISPGCRNCYAVGECVRLSRNPVITKKHGINPYQELVQINNGTKEFSGKLHFFEDRLDAPLRVKHPTVWFVNSLSDLFHPAVSLETLKRIFDIMNRADRHIFDILTKRGDRMAEVADKLTWTANIWQGVSFEGIPQGMTEGQRDSVMSRIAALRQHPAKVKFVSFEPLIGPVPPDLDLTGIDWAFFGGESHQTLAKARSMDLKWLRDGIALCQSFGCNPYVKQLGTAWASSNGSYRPSDRGGKNSAAWPQDLRPYAIRSLREVTPDDLLCRK